MKTVFHEATIDLATVLAPPRMPLAVRLFGTEKEPIHNSFPPVTARRRISVPSFVISATASVYSGVVWTLGGLTVILLLLAANKVGSYQVVLSAIQHGTSVGAVISARVAASTPFLLGALGSLAAAFGLFAIKAIFDQFWKESVLAYQKALKNWNSACYCPTDQIVFLRTVSTVRWDPVEELSRLIAQDGPVRRD